MADENNQIPNQTPTFDLNSSQPPVAATPDNLNTGNGQVPAETIPSPVFTDNTQPHEIKLEDLNTPQPAPPIQAAVQETPSIQEPSVQEIPAAETPVSAPVQENIEPEQNQVEQQMDQELQKIEEPETENTGSFKKYLLPAAVVVGIFVIAGLTYAFWPSSEETEEDKDTITLMGQEVSQPSPIDPGYTEGMEKLENIVNTIQENYVPEEEADEVVLPVDSPAADLDSINFAEDGTEDSAVTDNPAADLTPEEATSDTPSETPEKVAR